MIFGEIATGASYSSHSLETYMRVSLSNYPLHASCLVSYRTSHKMYKIPPGPIIKARLQSTAQIGTGPKMAGLEPSSRELSGKQTVGAAPSYCGLQQSSCRSGGCGILRDHTVTILFVHFSSTSCAKGFVQRTFATKGIFEAGKCASVQAWERSIRGTHEAATAAVRIPLSN